jgi:hypothetical protein
MSHNVDSASVSPRTLVEEIENRLANSTRERRALLFVMRCKKRGRAVRGASTFGLLPVRFLLNGLVLLTQTWLLSGLKSRCSDNSWRAGNTGFPGRHS